MSILLKIVRFFVFGNFHIALSSAIFVFGAFFLFDLPPDHNLIILIFCSTFVTYNLHRYIGLQKIGKLPYPERFQFTQDHFAALFVINGLIIITLLWSLTQINPSQLVWMIPLATITILYLSPVFHNEKRLRDFPWIKIFLISIVWAFIFVYPYFTSSGISFDPILISLIFLEKLLFIFALTLPFDIRDRDVDAQEHVQTLVHKLGIKRSVYWIMGTILACGIISLVLYLSGIYTLKIFIMLLFTYLLQWVLTRDQSVKRSELFYLGTLDGLILIHGVVYLI